MKKILVAEDDKFLASAYKMKLSKAGFSVSTFYDGQQAIDNLDTIKPDLVILDLVMPNLDGFAFLDQVKKTERWKNIPIIIASNLSQSDDVVKAMKMGADDYIVKTDFSMKEILKKIKKFVGNEINLAENESKQTS